MMPLTLAAVHGEPSILSLIATGALDTHFQPIVELRDGRIHGHEALVRGPRGTPCESPDALFAAARRQGVEIELEIACVKAAVRRWAAHRHPGKLFVNLSARALVEAFSQLSADECVSVLRSHGMTPSSVVLELTEHEHVRDFGPLLRAAEAVHAAGMGLALDDFGDGRSSLRLWAELKPGIVKIDKYFAKGVATHAAKLQTLRALLQIAEVFGTTMVAEGLETPEDLKVVRDLGIALGQGYLIGRPGAEPVSRASEGACDVLHSRDIAVFPELRRVAHRGFTAARFIIDAPCVSPATTHDELIHLFHEHERLHAVAIVDDGRPVGLLNRQQVLDRYTKPYFKELYGRRPCTLFANLTPLLVDVHTGVEDLTAILTSEDQRYLADGFVITEHGLYRGLGTGEQLVRAVTELRIEAARHANPLTFLPGNIPISDHIARLLASGCDFVACYGDLNHFKPFNDHYGYWRGDEMIRLAARAFVTHCDPRRDFVGHVGGDDFVVLFQSEDWMERCQRILESFNERARDLFDAEALAAGGIDAEDRHGVMRFFPCTTLSIGALRVRPGTFTDPDAVASAAASAKRLAKAQACGLHVVDAGELSAAG
ncbi:MAG TPA: phosphodiesterase [Burkholderiaceae bacterium]|nr:phosphodiesterase [Burkholderiaceae bacterium]